MSRVNDIPASDLLVAITDIASKVDSYVASMREIVGKVIVADKKNIARIEALERLLKSNKETLSRAKSSAGCKGELAKALEEAESQLTMWAKKLAELKAACHKNRVLSTNNASIDQVAQSVRSQIGYALDIIYD